MSIRALALSVPLAALFVAGAAHGQGVDAAGEAISVNGQDAAAMMAR